MIRELIYALLGLVVLTYVIEYAFSFGDDAREPKRVRSKIPLIGHLVGLLRYGPAYYSKTSKETNEELYTLGIFNFKLYVCNSRALLPVIQKHSKTLSFRPFILLAAKQFSDVTDATAHVYGLNLDTVGHTTMAALAPGPSLDDQNLRTGNRLLVDLEALTTPGEGARQIMLLEWMRHTIVQATSCGIYGARHPYLDPRVEQAFWKWHEFLPLHVAGLGFLSRKGHQARQTVFDALQQYTENIPDDCSWLFKERWRAFTEQAGIDGVDSAKLEAAFAIAAFTNTVPTAYWATYELFSRPEILARVRKELKEQALTVITRSSGGGLGRPVTVLDVAALKTRCPTLLSFLEETQRTRHIHANIRQVMEDTFLEGEHGTYLLKKGNYLQMPGGPIHYSQAIYGPNAANFDPYRFVPDHQGKKASALPGSSFLPWGAPPHLCPARQFASTEMLIMLALLVMRVDMKPTSGGWERYPALTIGEMATLLGPKKDVEMDIWAREEWAGEWRLEMGESKTRLTLTSG